MLRCNEWYHLLGRSQHDVRSRELSVDIRGEGHFRPRLQILTLVAGRPCNELGRSAVGWKILSIGGERGDMSAGLLRDAPELFDACFRIAGIADQDQRSGPCRKQNAERLPNGAIGTYYGDRAILQGQPQ